MTEAAHGAEEAMPNTVAGALLQSAQAGDLPRPTKPRRRRAAILAVVGGAALSIYLWLIATDGPSQAALQTITDHLPESFRWLATLQGLRGWANPQGADGYNGWFWFYNSAVPEGGWGWWIVWLVGGAAVLAVILEPSWRARSRPSRGQAALAVAWLVVVAYQLQIGAIRLKTPDATDRIVGLIMHNGFTGYFDTARTHRHFDDLLAAYDGEGAARRVDGHAATHPPGSVIFLWLPMVAVTSLPYAYSRKLINFTVEVLHIRASGMNLAGILDALLSGELILFLTALAVLPLYGCAKLIAGEQWAIPLAGLGVLCPAVLIHTPFLDCMYPTLALSLMLLVLKVSRDWTRPVFRGALAGTLASLATLMSYGLAALAVPFAIVLTVSVFFGGQELIPSAIEVSRRQRVTAACSFIGTLLLVLIGCWALLIWAGHFSLIGSLQLAASEHARATGGRPYAPYLFLNLTDFAQGMGVPIAAASLAMLWPLSKAHLALPARVNVFACGLWATIIVLDVSGVVRGEVGRIWIFLMPLGFLCVAREIGRGRLGAKGLALLAVSQAVTCCFIARFWRGFY